MDKLQERATKFRERFGKFGLEKKKYKQKTITSCAVVLIVWPLTQFGIQLLQHFDATAVVDEARPKTTGETKSVLFSIVVAIVGLLVGNSSLRRRRNDARYRHRDARPEETLARPGRSRGLDGGQMEESRQSFRARSGGGGQGEVGLLLLLLTLRLGLARRSTSRRHVPGHGGRGRAAGRWEGHATVSMLLGMGQ